MDEIYSRQYAQEGFLLVVSNYSSKKNLQIPSLPYPYAHEKSRGMAGTVSANSPENTVNVSTKITIQHILKAQGYEKILFCNSVHPVAQSLTSDLFMGINETPYPQINQ